MYSCDSLRPASLYVDIAGPDFTPSIVLLRHHEGSCHVGDGTTKAVSLASSGFTRVSGDVTTRGGGKGGEAVIASSLDLLCST